MLAIAHERPWTSYQTSVNILDTLRAESFGQEGELACGKTRVMFMIALLLVYVNKIKAACPTEHAALLQVTAGKSAQHPRDDGDNRQNG
jgi:hypothetical protein